jgi:DNA-binding CsgD family transcriptional regulator
MSRVFHLEAFNVGGTDELDRIASPAPGPDEEYEAAELFARMKRGLSERELRILEGLAAGVTAAEMAEEEGVALSRMRALIMEVRRKVRAGLDK